MWYDIMSLPAKCDYMIFSACFWVEGFLFYFHLRGHSDISVRLHTILYIIIFITAAAFLADVFFGRVYNRCFALMRAILLGVQGTWFLQIAFCSLRTETPGRIHQVMLSFWRSLSLGICLFS